MNPAQLPFLVEGILLLTAMVFGLLLHIGGKPYGKVKLAIHLFFFLWFTVGFAFILHGLFTMSVIKAIWIPIAIMGLAVLAQPVSGIVIMASKKAGNALPKTHLFFAVLMILSDISAFIISGLHA